MNWRIIIVCSIGLGFFPNTSQAQKSSRADILTVPGLQKQIQSVQANNDLAAGVKDKILPYLQEAVERIEIAQEQIEAAEKFERRLPQVSTALRSTQSKLSALPAAVDPSIVNVQDLEELTRMVELREKQLDDTESGLRKQLTDLDAESERRRVRPEDLMTELSEVEDRLREIEDESEGLATSGEPRELMKAHQLFLLARRQRAEGELRALKAESDWYQSPAAADLLQAQQEFATKNLALKIAELELLQSELGKRRSNDADQRVRQSERVVAQVAASLKPLAEENLVLAKEQRDITTKLSEVEHKHETTSASLGELQKEFDKTRKMVDEVDLTDSVGLLLRQQRAKLLDPRAMRLNLSRRNEIVRECRMRLFQLEADCTALIDLDAATAKRAEAIEPIKDRKLALAGLRDLLVDQRQLCKGLEVDYTKYFKQLIEMDLTEKRLLDLTVKYADYVDERVLWIRTGQPFGREHLAKLTPSLTWISDGKQWKPVIDTLTHDFSRQPVLWALAAIILMVWVGIHPLLSGLIHRKGITAAEVNCRDLRPTLQTISLTLAIASGWPITIWFLGWRLDHASSAVPFVHAVSSGLYRAVMFVFPLEVLRVVCFRGGLAEWHFDWPPQLVNGWRRNLNWFLPIGVLTVGVIGLVEGTSDEHRIDSIGRMAFLVFTGFSAIFCQLTLRRTKTRLAATEGMPASDNDVWSDRFWRFAPTLAVIVCTGLFLLGWSGYFYTALQLTWRLQSTAWVAIGLLMVRATIRRWIALERRRMAVLQDEELQTITDAEQEPGNSDHNPFLFPRWNWPDFRLNLTQIVTQMRSLLDTVLLTLAVGSLWLVWADVTPALNILDSVTLWHTTVEQTVTKVDDENGPSIKSVMRPKRVTAENLGVAILIVAIAVIAGRNIPGLVEVILLEHLSVDAGIRFAATCLVRYAIFLAGISGAFAQIGIGWNNIQWLVAAASVGLGFGLQEIFCNFVSGIILLFERPMRVGDVITIGDTTGTISRIRFRATTIVDGDRKELIVPNKEFITGKLLNWTLSDRVNRVGVKVVVASSCDPQKVRRLLLEIAGGHPQLLQDPPPSATLEDVNGGLTFMLRGFLPSLDGRGSAIHDLYTVIHNRFKDEGIEMSCPSQEILVRMDNHEAHSSSPPAPHQTSSPVPMKPVPSDFNTTLRRA